MQPAIPSNRLGIETDFQLSRAISPDVRAEILTAVGLTIPDYRFWIPGLRVPDDDSQVGLTRVKTCSHTVLLSSVRTTSRRTELLKICLSLGFELNEMLIPTLVIGPDRKSVV